MIDAVEFRKVQTYAMPGTELGEVLEARRSDDAVRRFKNIGHPGAGRGCFDPGRIGTVSDGKDLPLVR